MDLLIRSILSNNNNNIIIIIIIIIIREERRVRVFENRIMRRLFGPKRDSNGEWRRLHNEELSSLYCSPNISQGDKSRRLRWAGHVARMEEDRSSFKILTGRPYTCRKETFRKA